jgi:hypothetical protein
MLKNAQPRASRVARTLIAAAVIGALVLGACGGDDDDAGSDGGGSTGESSDSGELVDNEVRDVITDAVGTDGDVDLDAAIATLSPETRYSVVAGQLDPEPDVQIDGSDIRLVFSGGSLVDATMSCIIGSVVQEESETLTVVYPDGEKVC